MYCISVVRALAFDQENADLFPVFVDILLRVIDGVSIRLTAQMVGYMLLFSLVGCIKKKDSAMEINRNKKQLHFSSVWHLEFEYSLDVYIYIISRGFTKLKHKHRL